VRRREFEEKKGKETLFLGRANERGGKVPPRTQMGIGVSPKGGFDPTARRMQRLSPYAEK